jgi:cellulose synthase/poly-beta-1,6-N-acetylglucosamine synthase-like glycosyltransferase
MLNALAPWLGRLVLALLALQVVLLLALWQQLRQRRRERSQWPPAPSGGWPRAEVVLCLKGADATLPAVLEALAAQQYPAPWRLQVVIDGVDDPAWAVVQGIASAGLERLIQPLAARPAQGSLKCAALRQAMAQLQPDTAVVAIVDADAVVPPHWLATLVQACLQPGIGAVSGNRWYVPEHGSWSGSVRAVWNAGVVLAMSLARVPWGGSLAVRREVVNEGSWLRLLERGLCEDTGLLGPLRRLGLSYAFEPELLILDRDDSTEIRALSRWIQRQLLTVRLHHPVWPLALLYGVASLLLPLLALAAGAWQAVVVYELGLLLTLHGVEAVVRQRPLRLHKNWLLALAPAQLIHSWAIVAAWWARRVEWRGVVYRVQRRPAGVAILNQPLRSSR